MSTSIIKYIFEVVLIVLGVFLGLFVNELRIEQRDLARAERALEQITAELQFNQKMITRISVHHVAVKDSLDALLSRTDFQENTVTLPELWKSMLGGFGVVGLQRQAWTLANRLGSRSPSCRPPWFDCRPCPWAIRSISSHRRSRRPTQDRTAIPSVRAPGI